MPLRPQTDPERHLGAETKLVGNALSLAGHPSAGDTEFVTRVTSILKSTKAIYEEHAGSDLGRSATFAVRQISRSTRFIKLGANASPARASAAILAVMSEKVAFAAGFSADDQRVKCGAAITALAGNTAATIILGVGTGGFAISLTVLSLASSLMEANRQCRIVGN